MRSILPALAGILLVLATSLASPAAAADSPGDSLAALRQAALDPERAVELRGVRLATGAATLRIEEGVVVPAVDPTGAVAEMVFLGRARLELDAPNEVEAGQLELFTGARRLDEVVTEAVLVLANDAAAASVLGRAAVTGLADSTTVRATEIYSTWRSSPERRYLEIELSVLRDRLGEPLFDGYFAGWFRGERLGDFLYVVDPESPEQVTIGAFEPLELDDKERRKLERQLHRVQRRGRLRGRTVEDLGQWNTWLAATRSASDGTPRPGSAGFEPRHYTLDVHVDKEALRGTARIDLTAVHGASRTLVFTGSPDLEVRSARAGDGTPLPLVEGADAVLVVLPTAPPAGTELVVELGFDGPLLSKFERKSFQLIDTLGWYPRTGTVDLATYDVTLHRPPRIELIGAGRRVGGGAEPSGAWERRVLDVPSVGYSFEVGSFRSYVTHAGGVEITLHVDHETAEILGRQDRQKVLDALSGSLAYFTEIYGPYPLDYLTVVTAPRLFSQSLLGFVTLSSLMMADLGVVSYVLQFEDPRTVVAHEVAHQWWGHRVAPKSYRDAWLSEATANYSALLYARNRLADDGLRYGLGPVSGWQSSLTSTTADGRPLDSLGPLVLGDRLSSSFSASEAYSAVVYDKGAVVLDMLSRLYGEETFVRVLAKIAELADHRPVSTEEFLDVAERLTGTDLDPFAAQFVYSTGLPEVYYRYEMVPAPDGGKWLVTGTARQQTPYRYRYRVEPGPDGRLRVAREGIAQMEVADSLLVVPVQIAGHDPARPPDAEAWVRASDGKRANVLLRSHTLLRGAETEFRFELDYEPMELWLDRDQEVYGRFFNERRHPKRMLLYTALADAAAGRTAAAEEALERALAADLFAGLEIGDPLKGKDLAEAGHQLDAEILVELARLAHERGDLAQAAARLARLDERMDRLGRNVPQHLREARRVAAARLALGRGDARGAYDLLRKKTLSADRVESDEGLLLLAIAAQEVADTKELEAALDAVRDRGADIGPLLAANR